MLDMLHLAEYKMFWEEVRVTREDVWFVSRRMQL